MIEKYKAMRIQGERDKELEEAEEALRNAEQLEKATRVATFESKFTRTINKLTLLRKQDIIETLFEWSRDEECQRIFQERVEHLGQLE